MFSKSKTEKIKNNSVIFDFIKGSIVAVLISLGLVVLFAFCIKWFSLPGSVIAPVTFVIKGLSVLFGAMIAVKGESKGMVKGISFGAIYICFAFIIFSILAGTFSIGLSSFLDLISSVVIGAIVGIVKVNRK